MTTEMPDHYMYNKIDDGQFDLLGRMYEAEINYVDRALDNIYDTLLKDGRLGKTIIIVTSDHGENLGDHGHFAHVFSIHNSLLWVPLVVVFPDLANQGTVRRDTAQLLDLFPTILDWCRVHYDGRVDGRPLFAPGAESERRYAVAEYYYPSQVLSVFDPEELLANVERFYPFMKRQRAIQNDEYKLIWGSDGSRELYDITRDAGEHTNLLLNDPSHPALDPLVQELERIIRAGQGETPLDSVPPVGWLGPGFEQHIQDEELLKKLRSLGYIR
jgi:arylsulfatase A-like enzyme